MLSFSVWYCSKLCLELKILSLLLSYTAVVIKVMYLMNFTFKILDITLKIVHSGNGQ